MSTMKEIVENHPFSVLLATCITVAGISASVTGWFWRQSSSLNQLEFDNRITQITQDLSVENEDLKRRLISIERRVSGDKLYIDVTKIAISSVSLPTLHRTHKPFSSGKYYVAPPTFDRWESKAASQLDLVSVIFGEDNSAIEQGLRSSLGEVVSEKSGTLWKGSESIEVQLPSTSLMYKMLDGKELKISPFLFAMPVDSSLINRIAKAMGGELFESEEERKSIQEAKKTLSQLMLEDGNQVAVNSENELEESSVGQWVDLLSDMSRGDLAGFLLTDILISHLQFSVLTESKMKIVSADKKGNVMYLRTHIVFPAAHNDTNEVSRNVVFDEEFFFIGTSDGGVMVRTGVPSIEFQTDAYAWTQGWLTSLRVPLD